MSFVQRSKAAVIFDGQFGSTGKGLIAAYLALQDGNECDIATTNASANAGHTSIVDGKKFVTYHLPTFAVVQPDCRAYLNAGAIINVDLLFREIDELNFDLARLFIHPRAAVITQAMIDQEADNSSQATLLASTRKGVGTALAEKVMRRAPLAADHDRLKPFIKTYNLNECMDFGDRVVVEIPQGFSLGINSGLAYPYCTSRDVTVSQGLADAAIHPSYLGESMMCVRTFPIRVGNIKDGDNQIGWSGPCYPDQHETSFDHLGVEPELTTVTKRVRRIFTWSNKQFRLACSINRPTQICLNFTNYNRSVEEFINLVNSMDKAYKSPTHFGMGPAVEEVTTDEQDVIAMLKKKQHVA